MTIIRLNHVQITVPKDAVDQARAFYCDVLGLTEIEKPEALQGRGGFWLTVGDSQVHVGIENGVDRSATKAHVAYEVDNLDVWRKRMTEQGVDMDTSVPIPGYDRFEIRDPFGNRVEFIQPSDPSLQDQIAYYRARAGEYDEWFYRLGRYDYGQAINQQWFDEAETVMQALHTLGPVDTALELASGTGIWTEQLLKVAQHITALDASPEVLEINRKKLDSDRVTYQQADLFQWQPEGTYDLILFGFWLSHVPPEKLDAFFTKVASALNPGGKLFIIDSLRAQSSTAHDHTPYQQESIQHTRKLNDGREFTIYKVFYEPQTLRQQLSAYSITADVRTTENYFLYVLGEKSI